MFDRNLRLFNLWNNKQSITVMIRKLEFRTNGTYFGHIQKPEIRLVFRHHLKTASFDDQIYLLKTGLVQYSDPYWKIILDLWRDNLNPNILNAVGIQIPNNGITELFGKGIIESLLLRSKDEWLMAWIMNTNFVFQAMAWIMDHSVSRPIDDQRGLDHLNTKLVQYLDN